MAQPDPADRPPGALRRALIPLALKGVNFRPLTPTDILARNLFTYGLGGILLPFLGIKLIDMLITTLGLA